MRSEIIAAFCGTGKTYLCNNFSDKCTEVECWEYRDGDFPRNYIKDVKLAIGNYKYIFISTDPIILKPLNESGISIKLVYPKKELKSEYFKRFVMRGSNKDFMNAYNKYWNIWLDELKEQKYCEQIVLNKNEYLKDIIIKNKRKFNE